MTTSASLSSGTLSRPSWTWLRSLRCVSSRSRSSSVSPTQRIGSSPAASAAGTFSCSARSVSLWNWRRSECPSTTPPTCRSVSIAADISPVKAPETSWCMFWADTITSVPSVAATAAVSAVNGTQSPTSTPWTPSIAGKSSPMDSHASETVLCIFQLPAMYGRRRSGIVERLHARQRLALEQLERCSAACGEVGHLVGQSKLREGRCRVASTDDGSSLRSCDRLGHGTSPGRKRLHLERAHRPVPEHRTGLLDLASVCLRRRAADVEPNPSVRHLHAVNLLKLRRLVEAVAEHEVEREQQPAAAVSLSPIERLAREVHALLLDQRVAGRLALRAKEAEAHRAADQDGVGTIHEAVDQADLVAHLRPAEHDDEWPRRVLDQALERRDLLLEQQPGRRGQVLGHAGGRGMRAVGRAERVVHVGVRERRELGCQRGIVRRLTALPARVLEHDRLARLYPLDPAPHLGAHDLRRLVHPLAEQLAQVRRDGRERRRRVMALGAAEVRAEDEPGPALTQ